MDWNKAITDVVDEQSFLRFLRLLRDDSDPHPFGGEELGWETTTVREFLDAAIDWGAGGDFGAGRHHGDPMLRRVAAMLFSGRFKVRRPPDDDERD